MTPLIQERPPDAGESLSERLVRELEAARPVDAAECVEDLAGRLTMAAAGFLGPSATADRCALFAVVAHRWARAGGYQFWDRPAGVLAQRLDDALGFLRVVEAVRAAAAAELDEAYDTAAEFAAIIPTKLKDLAMRPGLADRVAAFVESRQRFAAASEWETEISRRLSETFNLDPGAVDHLLSRLPAPRLRTYSEAGLAAIAENVNKWSWCIRILTDRDEYAAAPVEDREKLTKLIKATARVVAARHRGGDDAQSAAHDAVLRAIHAYDYRSPLDRWLSRTAINARFGGEAGSPGGREDDGPAPPPRPDDPTPPPPEVARVAELIRRQGLFARIARNTFRNPGQCVVARIAWEQLVDEGLGGEPVSESELASRASAALGTGVKPGYVAVTRYRLRCRMAALDRAVHADPPEPTDRAVVNWVFGKYRRDATGDETDPDYPVLMRLAAWGRVFRSTGHWPSGALPEADCVPSTPGEDQP